MAWVVGQHLFLNMVSMLGWWVVIRRTLVAAPWSDVVSLDSSRLVARVPFGGWPPSGMGLVLGGAAPSPGFSYCVAGLDAGSACSSTG